MIENLPFEWAIGIDCFKVSGRGVAYLAQLQEDMNRSDFQSWLGKRVLRPGGHEDTIAGVESQCIENQRKGSLISILFKDANAA